MGKNKIIIISGPSGVGKKTVIDRFINDKDINLKYSISATTRKPRVGEIHGKDYYFLTPEEFDNKIKSNDFLEWAEFAGNKYGTLKSELNKILNHHNVILEIEVQGAMQVIKNLKEWEDRLLSIFIVPPSIEELEKRLRIRNTETDEKIKLRLEKAKNEMQTTHLYDHVIVNDDIEDATSRIIKIIKDSISNG